MSIKQAASADHATPLMAATRRIDAIDVLRGAVMVLMVIDHTRDFFGNAATRCSRRIPGWKKCALRRVRVSQS